MKNVFKSVSMSDVMSSVKSVADSAIKAVKKDKDDEKLEVVKMPKYGAVIREIDNAMESMGKLYELYAKIIVASSDEGEHTFYMDEQSKCVVRQHELQDVRDALVLKQSFERISEQLGESNGKELLDQLAKKIMSSDK